MSVLSLLLFPCLLLVLASVEMSREGRDERRVPNCSGCSIPHNQHDFGPVGPYCNGFTKENPAHSGAACAKSDKTKMEVEEPLAKVNRSPDEDSDNSDEEDAEIALLQERLEQLSFCEQNIRKTHQKQIVMDLRQQIAEKEQIVEILEREGCQLSVKQYRAVLEDSNGVAVARVKGDLNPGVQTRSFTIKDVKKTVLDRMKTPLDAILENIQEHDLGDASRTDSSWRRNLPEPVPLSTTFAMNSGARKKEYPFGGVLSANPHVYSGPDPAELFLNPNLNKGKHALLIPDFISKVVLEQEENVISLGKNTRLSVTCDNRRPKLSEVSLSEFNIANTRILFRLIETGQLPTYSD